MRVAVFTDADFDAPNGLTTTLTALVRQAPADIRPKIYTFSDLEVDEPEFLACSRLRAAHVWALQRRLERDEVKAVHLTTTGIAGLAARYVARRAGLPLIGSAHAWTPRRTAWHDRYARWLYAACDRILVPSDEIARRIGAARSSGQRTMRWPQGVDGDLFRPSLRSERLRTHWRVSERRLAILVAGRSSLDAGPSFVDALSSRLHRNGVAHRFIIAAEPSSCHAMSQACPDAVFTGALSQRDLAIVMASSDVLVHPAESRGGCHTVLEAQASGLPVVAGGESSRDNVQHGRTGYVCRPDDGEALAAWTTQILTDREHRRMLADGARRYALTRTWASSLDLVYGLYREAADRGLEPEGRFDLLVSAMRHSRSAGRR